jgi:hypothetical protein
MVLDEEKSYYQPNPSLGAGPFVYDMRGGLPVIFLDLWIPETSLSYQLWGLVTIIESP